MKEKEILLICEEYVENGWYGDRYRTVVVPEEGKTFSTKTEANKYKGKLKKLVKSVGKSEGKGVNTPYVTDENPPDYIYCGKGPSTSYTRKTLTVAELLEKVGKLNYSS